MNDLFEIELKYAADHVCWLDFEEKVKEYLYKKYDTTNGKAEVTVRSIDGALDTFYLLNGLPIRFRRKAGANAGKGELTIKVRHQADSTVSRDEIDLFLVPPDKKAVDAFMGKLGGKELFTLTKDYCLFEVKTDKLDLDVVIYHAYNDHLSRYFIEVEVGKKSKISTEKAMVLVGKLGKDISKMFKLGPPLNQSLFEIFNENHLSRLRDV